MTSQRKHNIKLRLAQAKVGSEVATVVLTLHNDGKNYDYDDDNNNENNYDNDND